VRYVTLGSGSRGNALLIETRQARVLVDCGFTAKEMERRLALLQVDIQSLDAVLATHEHTDHVRGLVPLTKRYGLPVWMTAGTCKAAACGSLPRLNLINSHNGDFKIGDLEISPFPVPHDSREPCQFVFQSRGLRLGLLTDTGHITPHIFARLKCCDSLILEFNHDREMLASGPYPPSLQSRVGGRHGHLCNDQSLEMLARIDTSRLQSLTAAHLSEKNNQPELVRKSVREECPDMDERFFIASQERVGAWTEIVQG
jgi:phosphoribosyl 1,2-cyclic phosphodiesterase